MSSQNTSIETVTEIQDPAMLESDVLTQGLADHINQLILTNFERLVQLLYRIDVSEMKLKQLLKENPEKDAGMLIARMIIDRQIQKILFRKEMEARETEDGGEERW